MVDYKTALTEVVLQTLDTPPEGVVKAIPPWLHISTGTTRKVLPLVGVARNSLTQSNASTISDSFPEIAALYRRVEHLLQDVRNITRTRGQILTQSIPMSTALDVRRVNFNCKGLPNEIEFIDVPRRETSVQAQRL